MYQSRCGCAYLKNGRSSHILILATGLFALFTTGATYARPVRETISGLVSSH